ncbi:GAF domain-containing sensor histidine kinase [Desulfothermus sp.]
MKKDTEKELGFLRSIINILSSDRLSLSQKMDKSLRVILRRIQALKGSIMLYSKEKNTFQIVAATNKKILDKEIPVNPDSISGYVFTTGEPVFFKDIRKSKKFKSFAIGKNYNTPSLICVPLKMERRILGVINVSDHKQNRSFMESDFAFLKDYASILSPLIENSCLFHKLKEEKEKYKKLSEELKISKEELLMTYTERQELVQMVVHDFKSPLSAIISNLDLLKYIGLNDQQKQIVDTALNGAKKLLDMINEFLQIAKVDQFQKDKIKFEPVSLLSVLNEVIEELKPQADIKSIKIIQQSQKDVMLWGTHSLFVHLIQNLISNAIKYTPENGLVKISWEVLKTQRAGDKFKKFAKICIEDTGPGIPDDLKKVVFNRFERLKRDKGVQGTGIGLFICKRIVNILEGRIWIEDAKPQGSRFCFSCYVCEEEE